MRYKTEYFIYENQLSDFHIWNNEHSIWHGRGTHWDQTFSAHTVGEWFVELERQIGVVSAEPRRRQWKPIPVLSPGKEGAAWLAAVHGVARSQTWLSDITFPFHFNTLEREMTTHSSILAWRILGMAEPGGLPYVGSHRVGHDWSGLAVAAAPEAQRG